MNDEPTEFGFLHPGDEVSRFGNCVLIRCQDEDNAIVILEIFRDIAGGKKLVIGLAPDSQGNA